MTTPPPAIHLREVHPDDLAILVEHQMDEQANHMAAFTPEEPDDPVAQLRRWERLVGEPSHLIRVVLYHGEVVGHVASFDREGEREVTYWVDRRRWGQGIATAALRSFLPLEAARPLHARAAADNLGSLRVLEKCGFRRCGLDRGYASARGREMEEVHLVLTIAREAGLKDA